MSNFEQRAIELLQQAVSGIELAAERIRIEAMQTSAMWGAPHAVMRPRIGIDGDQYCVLYGENIQEGIAGFGDSPHEAMLDFDRNWYKGLKDTGHD